MPRSPLLNCCAMNIEIKSPKPRMQPQTLESFHGYVVPPHCSASSRQTIEQIRKRAPSRSISSIFCLIVMLTSFRFGFLKKIATAAIEMAPNGKFIQKHHLHETLSVKAPPSSGPTTDEMPNMLDKAAMYIGLLIKGTVKPTIVIPLKFCQHLGHSGMGGELTSGEEC